MSVFIDAYSEEAIKGVADYFIETGVDTSKWGVTPYEMAKDFAETGTTETWSALCDKAGLNVYTNVVPDPDYVQYPTVYGRNVGVVTDTGVETTGTLAVKTSKTATGSVTAEPFKETTTASGKTISKGGAITGINTVMGAYMAAQTAGLIAKDWNNHTDWWNDLSDAVFGTGVFEGTTIKDYDTYGSQLLTNVGQVIVRRVQDTFSDDPYYTSFMSEENLASYYYALAKEGCFDGSISFDYEEPAPTETVYKGTIAESYISRAVTVANSNAQYYLSNKYLIPSFLAGEVWQRITSLSDFNELNYIYAYAHVSNYDSSTLSVTVVNINKPIRVTEVDRFQVSSLIGHQITVSVSNRNPEQYTITQNDNLIFNGGYMGDIRVVNNVNSNCQAHTQSAFTEIIETGGREETPENPDGTIFVVPAGDYTIDDIKRAIAEQFPDWYADGFEEEMYDPTSDTTKLRRYLPITMPNVKPTAGNVPSDYTQPYSRTGRLPKESPEAWINISDLLRPYIKTTSKDTNPEPDDTPKVPILAGSSSNSLWAVYNPTMGEIRGVGSYLWSESIIDIIQKFFANPMEAIISLHLVYCTPITGGTQNIKLGYLDTGVSSKIVTNQFVTIDCGTITVPEYFGDVRDYSPYTQVYIYLPFIGIRAVSTEDVIGCNINVTYNIDVLTGAILCNITVYKRGASQILYTFAGNCSVQIPLTGADRSRLISGVLSTVGSAVSGGAVGGGVGAVIGAGAGLVNGLHNAGAIDRTGNFSSNAGAMGVKQPYIIVQRKTSYDAEGYNRFYGYPSNNTVSLSSCSGYTRVKDVHVDNISTATENEKKEIENLLKSGVIIR